MSLVTVGIACVFILVAGLLLMSELRTYSGRPRPREGSGENYSVSGDVHNASFMGQPVDTGHGQGGPCGEFGYGHAGGCDGSGHHG